jgi:anti-sigma B factor antagonist
MLDEELHYRMRFDDAADGGACTVQLRDHFLNYAFSDQLKASLRAACAERLARGVRKFVLDLTPVSVMDSCGLSVVIGLRKLVESGQGRLVIVAASPILLRLFSITRLDSVFEIVPSVEAAAKALEREPAPQYAASAH